MKKNFAPSPVAIIPKNPLDDVSKLIPAKDFETLSFWQDLTDADQSSLVEDSRELAAAVLVHNISRLAMGERLQNIHDRLMPYKGAWTQFLRKFPYSFSSRTAQLYMDMYRRAREAFHPNIVKVIMLRNVEMFASSNADPKRPYGMYTSSVKKLPPPERPTIAAADKWIESVVADAKSRPARATVAATGAVDILIPEQLDPAFLQEQAFRIVKNNMNKVPPAKKRKWLFALMGMWMTELKIKDAVSVAPADVPESYAQGRGRPKGPKLLQDDGEGGTLEAAG